MNIWCKFGKDWLKNEGLQDTYKKNGLGFLVVKSGTAERGKIYWYLVIDLRNVWCDFKKRSVENSMVYSVHKKQMNLAPQWP